MTVLTGEIRAAFFVPGHAEMHGCFCMRGIDVILPKREIFREKVKQGNLIPLYTEIYADLETPVSAFLKLRRGGFNFLLESVEGGTQVGRYSFLGRRA
ncbi:hypothetical protein ES705_19032 [subsurface metagenome]